MTQVPPAGCWRRAVLARLLLAQDRPDQAPGLLDRLDRAAAGQGRAGSLLEIRALRALALAALGDDAAATAALAAALRSGSRQGYIRVFADEGPGMAAVLGQLIAAQRNDPEAAAVPLAYLARLRRALGAGRPPENGAAAGPRMPQLAEKLTGRELEVLACWPRASRTRASPAACSSRWTRSRSMSATCWPSWAPATAPGGEPGAGAGADRHLDRDAG
jgi:LuxR family maltose regulon positive regulatory protein